VNARGDERDEAETRSFPDKEVTQTFPYGAVVDTTEMLKVRQTLAEVTALLAVYTARCLALIQNRKRRSRTWSFAY
jgi:hypothetical protein